MHKSESNSGNISSEGDSCSKSRNVPARELTIESKDEDSCSKEIIMLHNRIKFLEHQCVTNLEWLEKHMKRKIN